MVFSLLTIKPIDIHYFYLVFHFKILKLGLVQGIMRSKATTSSEVYSYTFNINRMFI